MALPWFCYQSAVQGHHFSKNSWIPAEVEILSCISETSNRFNLFAVAVKKNGVVVGHAPRKIVAICSLFL